MILNIQCIKVCISGSPRKLFHSFTHSFTENHFFFITSLSHDRYYAGHRRHKGESDPVWDLKEFTDRGMRQIYKSVHHDAASRTELKDLALLQGLSAVGGFVLRRHFAMSGGILGCHN